MKRRTKQILLECAIVMVVLSVLLIYSIPRFLQEQSLSRAHIYQETVDQIAQAISYNPSRIFELMDEGRVKLSFGDYWIGGMDRDPTSAPSMIHEIRTYRLHTLQDFFPGVSFSDPHDTRIYSVIFDLSRGRSKIYHYSVYVKISEEDLVKSRVNLSDEERVLKRDMDAFIPLPLCMDQQGDFWRERPVKGLYDPSNGIGSCGILFRDGAKTQGRFIAKK